MSTVGKIVIPPERLELGSTCNDGEESIAANSFAAMRRADRVEGREADMRARYAGQKKLRRGYRDAGSGATPGFASDPHEPRRL